MKTMSQEIQKRFVMCIKNDGCDDLSVYTVYEVLPDVDADEIQYLRIIDDSGEDYLYPALYFQTVELSESLQQAFFLQTGNKNLMPLVA